MHRRLFLRVHERMVVRFADTYRVRYGKNREFFLQQIQIFDYLPNTRATSLDIEI